jgi:hypothetical protein
MMSTTTINNSNNTNTEVLDFDAFFANALAYQQQSEGGAPLDLDAFAAQLQSCTGTPFVRRESAAIAVADWPNVGDTTTEVRTVSWETANFKGERRIAAVLLLVRSSSPSGEWAPCTLFITTCDPFGLDNFTQPLGLVPLLPTSARAHWDPTGKKVALSNRVKTVEQRVFLEGKARDHMVTIAAAIVTHAGGVGVTAVSKDLQERIATSRFISSSGIREILGVAHAAVVPTAESLCTPDTSKEELKALEKAEKEALRTVAAALTPAVFYALYDGWLRYVASEMPLNLLPAEYKKRGRWLLLSKEEATRWDRRVFLYMLGARAETITESPYEAALWLALDAGCSIAEVSDDDARFAYKTPSEGRKLGEMLADFAADPTAFAWLLTASALLTKQQGAYMARLTASLAAGDLGAALHQLTEGTADPFNGQGLLGLSEVLLRELTARRIVFPDALLAAIGAHLANDAWALPLLAVPTTTTTTTTNAVARLLLIG